MQLSKLIVDFGIYDIKIPQYESILNQAEHIF